MHISHAGDFYVSFTQRKASGNPGPTMFNRFLGHSTSNKHSLLKADLLLVVVTLLAAISWMFSKEALTEFPPLLFMAIRFLSSGILLTVSGINQLQQLGARDIKQASWVGVVFGIAMSIWVMGLAATQFLGEASFLTSLAVPLVPLISWLLFREAVSSDHWIALPLAAIGLALLSLPGGFKLEASQWLFVTAAVLLAITFVLNGRAATTIPALPLSAIQLLWVGLLTGVLSISFEVWPTEWTASMSLWLVLSIIIGTAMRFYIQTIAQGMASPSHAAIILIIEPIWTCLFAAIWFDERMLAIQYLGCSVIFLALLANRRRLLFSFFK